MPTLGPSGNGLAARKARGTGSHLAETGHTVQTHWPLADQPTVSPPHTEVFDINVQVRPLAHVHEAKDAPSATVDGMFILNGETGALHDSDHLTERCNTDQIGRSSRIRSKDKASLMADKRFKHLCRWCNPITIENPDPPKAADDAEA